MVKHKQRRVCGYYRVSTREQIDRISLDEQCDRIREYATKEKWELVAEYREEGKSAAKEIEKRTEFQQMLADAYSGQFDTVMVTDIDRFSRNPRDYHFVMDELSRLGVELLILESPDFDPTNPGDEFKRNVELAFARYQAQLSRAKTIRALLWKLQRGELNIGQRIPYGLRWTAGNKKLEHDPETIKVWNLMKHLRLKGYGYGRMADVLNGDEDLAPKIAKQFKVTFPVPNRYGMKVWRNGAIAKMFRDESRHTGKFIVTFKDLRGDVQQFTAKFPPLMTKHEFGVFQKMANANLTWKPRNVGKGSVLSGLCTCGLCGASLHVTASNGVRFYGCANRIHKPRKTAKRCTLPRIRGADLERLVLYEISTFLSDEEKFEQALQMADASLEDRAVNLEKLARDEAKWKAKAAEAKGRVEHLVEAISRGAIDLDDAKQQRERIRKDQDKAEQKLTAIESRRQMLGQDAARIEAVRQARGKYGRLWKWAKLAELSDQQKQDMLRGLLPPASGACITIQVVDKDTPTDPDSPDQVGSWYIEINGLLPLEDVNSKIGRARWGASGALIPACRVTRNPL